MDYLLLRGKKQLILIFVGLALQSGCGKNDGIQRVPLSGMVTFQGEPVVDGQLRLVPQPGTMVPLTIVSIHDGRYDAVKLGGVPVGRYRAEILSFDPATPAPTKAGDPPRKQKLPEKFNSQSTMELEISPEHIQGTHDFSLQP